MNKTTRRNLRTVRAVVLASGLAARTASAATVQQITGFGNKPTGIGMYLYTPSNAVSHPSILVGVHACHGKGTDVCAQGSPFAAQADKYGFLLICPSAVSSDGRWDVHSSAVLTHGGGGDASGIISMVDYVVHNKNGGASRVFVAGHSSGGMMTNWRLGARVAPSSAVLDTDCCGGPATGEGAAATTSGNDQRVQQNAARLPARPAPGQGMFLAVSAAVEHRPPAVTRSGSGEPHRS